MGKLQVPGAPTPPSANNEEAKCQDYFPYWRERGYLPHSEDRQIQMLTFRLYDSIPRTVIERWKKELEDSDSSEEGKAIKLREQILRYEDAGYGSCFLNDSRIARIVVDTMKFKDGYGYKLIRWVIMPNHVHVLLQISPSLKISHILKEWKSVSSHKADKILERKGEFWMREYHDRFIRDIKHLNDAIRYIDENPVRAGLVQFASDWKWSSAWEEAYSGL